MPVDADDGADPYLKILMSLQYDPAKPEHIVAGLQRWFGDGFRVLGADLATELETRPPLNQAAIRTSRDYGIVGEAWASMSGAQGVTDKRPGVFAYSEANFKRLLEHWVPRLLFATHITLYRIDEHGRPGQRGKVSLEARHMERDQSYLQMEAWFPPGRVTSVQRPDTLRWWRSAADFLNPTYGEISDGYYMTTKWELSHRLIAELDTIPKGNELLRGYSWITIAGQQVGDRLGGADGLLETGAFAKVEHLANGGYWLQATETLEDYDVEAEVRVHQALQAVLPGAIG
jgi:hypothetical protein